MIPTRDTVEREGPAAGVLIAIAGAIALAFAGVGEAGNTWQLLVGLLGLWLFGYYPARRLGIWRFLGLWLALLAGTALVANLLGEGGAGVPLLPAIAAVGLIHLALAPRSRTLCLVPIPFAMTFLEVPTAIILAIWAILELLLGRI